MNQTRPAGVSIRLLAPAVLFSACSIVPSQRNLSYPKTSGMTENLRNAALEALVPFVLSPTKTDAPEQLLILIPELKRASSEYISLARSVQERSPHRLWIAILDFKSDDVNPVQVDAEIERVFSAVRDLGFASVRRDNTTIAGHSSGGVIAQKYVRDKEFAGLVLLSSYLIRTDGRSSLPEMQLPVLTLTGDLDGQTRVTRIALDAKSSFDLAGTADGQQTLAEKPVVVLPGINHAQFADGKQLPTDLEPELSYETAQANIARTIADFIVLNNSDALLNDSKTQAFERMSTALQKTREIVEPYWNAREKDQTWCSEAQAEEASALPASLKLSIQAEKSHDLGSFAASKPKAFLKPSGELELSITYNLIYPQNVHDSSDIPESARALSCKNKSREAIRTMTELEQEPALSCAELNKKIFSWALDKVSPEVSRRFQQRGRAMVFADDREFSSGIRWLPSELSIENLADRNVAKVTSTALRSGLKLPAAIAGMHYCKLLAPTQVMEWILVDGLRK